MCYYVSVKEKNQLKGMLPKEVTIQDYQPGYFLSGFTHPELPVMSSDDPSVVRPAEWGLIPGWIKSADQAAEVQKKTLNARSETIFTTPMFRQYAPANRCLIFVDGFFEWKHEGKDKIPHFIYLEGHKIFAFGGLFADSHAKDAGAAARTCSIVTTPSNELMSDIHNVKLRMPLILPESLWSTWLDPSASRSDIEAIAKPYPEQNLVAHTIRPLTSFSEEEKLSPVIQQPHDWPKQTLF